MDNERDKMEFKQIKYFLEIANKGSFQLAANSLQLTQPALSQQISLLERELKETLFHRSKQGIQLTNKGKIFYNYAYQMKEIWRATEEGMRAKEEELAGNISIVAGGTVSAWVLPKLIQKVIKNYPKLTISVIEGDNLETKEYLKNGFVDLAFLTSPYEADSFIHSFPVLKDQIIPIVSKNHPILHKKNLRLEDLEKENFVYYHQGSAIRMSLEKSWKGKNLKFNPKIIMELRSIESIVNCVEKGLGIGFISSYALTNKIKKLNVPSLTSEREFQLAYRKNARSNVLLLAEKFRSYFNVR
jgi:DNA-binding transcriptional LysR family regulator